MKLPIIVHSTAAFLSFAAAATAADPVWWSARGVTTSAPTSNLSPATIGQAKWMARQALEELRGKLDTADHAALKTELEALMPSAPPTTEAGFETQRGVLLVGQLKAISKVFYDRLRAGKPAWLDAQMTAAGIRLVEPGTSPPAYSPYPWTETAGDDSNFSPATLGQLKAVFSLDLHSWIGTPGDSDSDGISDADETAQGTSPTLADSDGDGVNDLEDAFPLDPDRWLPLAPVAGDTTPPLVSLLAPVSAAYVSGP